MKIAKVGKKGKQKGIVVELEDQVKVTGALKDAVVDFSESNEKGRWMNFVRDINVTKLDVQKKGRLLKGKFKNNNYSSTGSCVVHFKERKSGKIRPSRLMKFKLKFHDVLDRQGLPDLEVSDYKFL